MEFSVQLQHAEKLGDLRDRCVVFHGVNKSGSLALARVIHAAYVAANREAEVHSHYHQRPATLEELLTLLAAPPPGHSFAAGHSLYGAFPRIPGRHAFVTQFRHPLPRVVSCHEWIMKRRALRGEPATMSLEEFVRRSQGREHSQFVQFGRGFGPDGKARQSALSNREIYEQALEAIERDVAWFGIAEHFEESIFVLAHLCGLGAVSPWKRDGRNPGRTMAWDLPPQTVALIEEVYRYDFELYAYAKAKFLSRIEGVDFGLQFARYRALCAKEYKDRLL